MTDPTSPLAGLRVVECSMLGPGAISTPLADLGADVIKVEPPGGDYARRMTWPIVEGTSLLHLHISRGKRSVVLDLRTAQGREVFMQLAEGADVVIEAMRPGGLERRGLGPDVLRAVNPQLVFCTISGYGATGPYRDLPSHGIAYDTWAGIVVPERDEHGHPSLPAHTSIGINAGPLYGALAILAAVISARASGVGTTIEVAQSDAAAAFDWLRTETVRAYERPAAEVTGNAADDFERRLPGVAGMVGSVRYQIYDATDAPVILMASERHFWRNFCAAVGRDDLFERFPGAPLADHARGNHDLHAELVTIFATRPAAEWINLGLSADFPIAPVNDPATLSTDPQFVERMPWLAKDDLGADQLPFPARFNGSLPPARGKAPTVGQHSDDVLRQVLGFDEAHLDSLREAGAFGPVSDESAPDATR